MIRKIIKVFVITILSTIICSCSEQSYLNDFEGRLLNDIEEQFVETLFEIKIPEDYLADIKTSDRIMHMPVFLDNITEDVPLTNAQINEIHENGIVITDIVVWLSVKTDVVNQVLCNLDERALDDMTSEHPEYGFTFDKLYTIRGSAAIDVDLDGIPVEFQIMRWYNYYILKPQKGRTIIFIETIYTEHDLIGFDGLNFDE